MGCCRVCGACVAIIVVLSSGHFGEQPPLENVSNGESCPELAVHHGAVSTNPLKLNHYSRFLTSYYTVVGGVSNVHVGIEMRSAGDVNGDGVPDAIHGVTMSLLVGEAYVVLGRSTTTTLVGPSLGPAGFKIFGAALSVVSGAGDVNGDGLADVLIGAWRQDSDRGHAYLIFGRASTLDVDVSVLDAQGITLVGANPGDQAGRCVSGLGDVNGDGYGDFAVGAQSVGGQYGAVYVIFGGPSLPSTILLSALGNHGFNVTSDGVDIVRLCAVSEVGDMNSDGKKDILVGAPVSTTNGCCSQAGSAWVIWGKSTYDEVRLYSAGFVSGSGFQIVGGLGGDNMGRSVGAAGDVNSDSIPDIIVGAPCASPNVGKVYVIFGKSDATAVNVDTLASGGGFVISGTGLLGIGYSVAGIGDLNGDSYGDVLVGQPTAAGGFGEAYIVYGKDTNSLVSLNALTGRGITITGADALHNVGYGARAGDVNLDDIPDFLVGGPGYMNGAGSAHLIFGERPPVDISLGVTASPIATASATHSPPASGTSTPTSTPVSTTASASDTASPSVMVAASVEASQGPTETQQAVNSYKLLFYTVGFGVGVGLPILVFIVAAIVLCIKRRAAPPARLNEVEDSENSKEQDSSCASRDSSVESVAEELTSEDPRDDPALGSSA